MVTVTQALEALVALLSVIGWIEVRTRRILADKLEVQDEKHASAEALIQSMHSTLTSFTDRMGEHVINLTAAISRLEGRLEGNK